MNAEAWKAEQRGIRELLRAPQPGSGTQVTPASDAPFASVIVVCWNSADVIARCLAHLIAQDYPSYEIIVVDDGSQDDTAQLAERALSGVDATVVRSPRNRGCPHARNLGLARAAGEMVAFVDADGFAAPDWLSRIVDVLQADREIGAVASTVFFDANPLVLNGAGGTVNRQGWAADLSMNEPYGGAHIPSEALYPMGCGMAMRRDAIGRVGVFDDRMLNYYDDVDYGIRMWRAGLKVAVASAAWVDHGVRWSTTDSGHKRLLCERHRMRVVLKHAPAGLLGRWAANEARTMKRSPEHRALKIRALAWNLRHLPGVLTSRLRMHGAPQAPERLIDPSWGEHFPVGMALFCRPSPEAASDHIDMAEPSSDRQLLFGWFPVERVDGRSYRWAADRAGVLVRLPESASRMRLDFAHVPVDTGGIDVSIRAMGLPASLETLWSIRLPWQYIGRSVENHPLSLPPGEYEVRFDARQGWTQPPSENRSLGLALSSLSFHASFQIEPGGVDMGSAAVGDQLVNGWFEPEHEQIGDYRWAGARSAAVIRLVRPASHVTLTYRLPPASADGVRVSMAALGGGSPAWSAHLVGGATEWHVQSFSANLEPGDYLVSFDAGTPWSNPDRRDPELWAENRTLGFALSALTCTPVA